MNLKEFKRIQDDSSQSNDPVLELKLDDHLKSLLVESEIDYKGEYDVPCLTPSVRDEFDVSSKEEMLRLLFDSFNKGRNVTFDFYNDEGKYKGYFSTWLIYIPKYNKWGYCWSTSNTGIKDNFNIKSLKSRAEKEWDKACGLSFPSFTEFSEPLYDMDLTDVSDYYSEYLLKLNIVSEEEFDEMSRFEKGEYVLDNLRKIYNAVKKSESGRR